MFKHYGSSGNYSNVRQHKESLKMCVQFERTEIRDEELHLATNCHMPARSDCGWCVPELQQILCQVNTHSLFFSVTDYTES